VLGYVWEPQRRGVGHLHVVVALPGARVVGDVLRDLAPAYGFGFVDDGSRSRRRGGGGGGVAGYLVGYLNGSKVPATVEAVVAGIVPHRSWYLASWLTMASGVTMRTLRRVRRWWAAAVGLLPSAPDMGCFLVLDLAGMLWGRRAPPAVLPMAA
jgi:hypothetical protein